MNSKIKKFFKISYDIFMFILAMIVSIVLYFDFYVKLTPQSSSILHIVDTSILIIFTLDYFIRLYLSNDRKLFFKSNLLDLISIMPFDVIFRAVRILRLLKIFRILKALKPLLIRIPNVKIIFDILQTNNLTKVIKFAFVLIFISSMGICVVEEKMSNFSDAIWWALVTTTTVGYGDFSPSTIPGRLIATLLMFVGIGLIGMISASIATFFIKNNNQQKSDEVLDIINSRISNIKTISEEDFNELLELIKIKRLTNDIK